MYSRFFSDVDVKKLSIINTHGNVSLKDTLVEYYPLNLKKDFMETIVVQPSNNEEMKMLKEFLQQRNIKSHVVNEEDKEDFVLGLLMQETDYDDVIDTNEFIKQLQGK